ncbi:hypothetical protein FKP32DRAFT_1590942 [Trametes sanguinea]|nr:hypothetical protein FKP32DRAFT_1590942 [Trametes sanguinea]
MILTPSADQSAIDAHPCTSQARLRTGQFERASTLYVDSPGQPSTPHRKSRNRAQSSPFQAGTYGSMHRARPLHRIEAQGSNFELTVPHRSRTQRTALTALTGSSDSAPTQHNAPGQTRADVDIAPSRTRKYSPANPHPASQPPPRPSPRASQQTPRVPDKPEPEQTIVRAHAPGSRFSRFDGSTVRRFVMRARPPPGRSTADPRSLARPSLRLERPLQARAWKTHDVAPFLLYAPQPAKRR